MFCGQDFKPTENILGVRTNVGFTLRTKRSVFEACTGSYCVTWEVKEEDLLKLENNDTRLISGYVV